MRYELKMVFTQGEQGKILQTLFSSPCLIREIYHPRQVNNIYFDSLNYSDYISAIHGTEFRKKYRIRWYGELFQENISPVLEMKYKRGWEGDKKNLPVPTFTLQDFSCEDYYQDLREQFQDNEPEGQQMLGELFSRIPVLVNTYQRRYFETAEGKFRFTLDEEMTFHDVHNCLQGLDTPISQDPKVLLELKFDASLVAEGSQLLNQLGFRISKNSKYVNGIESVVFHKHPMPF